jgi:hypothetical protein
MHTILYWQGAYGSLGLMRIMNTIAPITAIIMLNGFNLIFKRLSNSRTWFLIVFAVISIASAFAATKLYTDDTLRHKFKSARNAARHISTENLLTGSNMFFTSDLIVQCELKDKDDLPIIKHSFDREQERALLKNMPIGTIGVWDDIQGKYWYGIEFFEFDQLGYEKVEGFTNKVRTNYYNIDMMNSENTFEIEQNFIIYRKVK